MSEATYLDSLLFRHYASSGGKRRGKESYHHVDGLVQERRNSSALAIELRLSCTKPIYVLCGIQYHDN